MLGPLVLSKIPNTKHGLQTCESAALNMPANLENSAVATGLENVSFHSNPKDVAAGWQHRLARPSRHTPGSSHWQLGLGPTLRFAGLSFPFREMG